MNTYSLPKNSPDRTRSVNFAEVQKPPQFSNYKSFEKLYGYQEIVRNGADFPERKIAMQKEASVLKFLEKNSAIEWFLISPDTFQIVHANRNALEGFGNLPQNVLNKYVTEIFVTDDELEFKQRLHKLTTTPIKYFSVFASLAGKNRTGEPVELLVTQFDESPDADILVICRSLKKASDSKVLNFLFTDYDGVTRIPNHRLFERMLRENPKFFPSSGKEWGILTIYLENFQTIIEGLGFRAADKVIRQLVKTLSPALGKGEFFIRSTQYTLTKILPNCSEAEMRLKAQRVIDLITGYNFAYQGRKFKLQVNVGGVLVNSETPKTLDLLCLAATASKIAKEAGQNQFYLLNAKDDLFINKTDELANVLDMQDALERKRFRLYRQKIARISDDSEKYAEHYEILVRMVNKDNQLVPPTKFIPQLEKHGTIVFLDKWVLRESLKMIQKRYESAGQTGKKLLYNINLSGRTISDADFLECCTKMLTAYAHLAPFICFEITETAAISNLERVQEVIIALQKLGCKFALDDYGSGAVSLNHLRELPVDFVKIDGSYVSDIVENEISQIFVKAVREIAELLNIKVIAEKVEDQLIENALVNLGVHYAQGYKIHRPELF